jgi:hypothetical protein
MKNKYADPVAWTSQDELNALGTDVTCYMYSEPMIGENNIPLYTRPSQSRKPMTEEEIKAEAQSEKFNRCDAIVFAAGIRFAEKHHGIGGDDNG